MIIQRQGSKWLLLSDTGDQVLGIYDTKEAAEAEKTSIIIKKKVPK
jgi:hypothetical protein